MTTNPTLFQAREVLLANALTLLRFAEEETSHGLTANAKFIDQCVSSARKSLEEALGTDE